LSHASSSPENNLIRQGGLPFPDIFDHAARVSFSKGCPSWRDPADIVPQDEPTRLSSYDRLPVPAYRPNLTAYLTPGAGWSMLEELPNPQAAPGRSFVVAGRCPTHPE
jgi:hypothetical protein